MPYQSKDLRTQLIEFGARQVVRKAIDLTVKYGERSVCNEFQKRRSNSMFEVEKDTRTNTHNRYNGNDQDSYYSNGADEGLWVNTVLVRQEGAKPIRILMGRRLRTFRPDMDASTSNEEFNEINASQNAFVKMMLNNAEELDFGESKYYGKPSKDWTEEEIKEHGSVPEYPKLEQGIYVQLHRSITDKAASKTETMSREARAAEELKNFFG